VRYNCIVTLLLLHAGLSHAGIINWYDSKGNRGFASYNDGPGLIPTLMDLHQKGEEQELREKQFEAEQRAAKSRAKRELEQRAYRERVNALANSVASDLCEMFNEINRVEAWNEKALAFRDSLNKAISNNVEQAIEMMDGLYKEMSETLRQLKLKERQETLRVAEEAVKNEGWGGRIRAFFTQWRDSKKYPENIRLLIAQANEGDPNAQFLLGGHSEMGDKMEQNKGLALYWTRKAAGNGHIDAKMKLGLDAFDYEEYADAVVILSDALQQKSGKVTEGFVPLAQIRLGDCYFNGWGAERDQEIAIKFYRAAASAGNSVAEYKLKKALKEKSDQASKNKASDDFGFIPDPVKSASK
jgi:TPR repeat protein